jgi:tubulin-specific chaperone A
MADSRKALRIKTGVVKRLAKEKVSYEKEAGEQRERIQIYKDQGSHVAPSHL